MPIETNMRLSNIEVEMLTKNIARIPVIILHHIAFLTVDNSIL